jgi:hypothetical protein
MVSRWIILKLRRKLKRLSFLSLRCPGSVEGSMAECEDVDGEGSDSAARRPSWLDSHSSWRGLDLTMKEVFLEI